MICAALDDVGVQPVAPQIEEAVLEPDLLRIFLVAEHRHRQLVGRAQHLDVLDVDLDLTGRQIRVLGAAGTAAHLAVDPHHPFGAQRLDLLERRTVRVGDHLAQAIVVAQIDEENAAVVAHAVHPAGEPDLFVDVALAERAAGVGAIAMHSGVRRKRPLRGRARALNRAHNRTAPRPMSRLRGLMRFSRCKHP